MLRWASRTLEVLMEKSEGSGSFSSLFQLLVAAWAICILYHITQILREYKPIFLWQNWCLGASVSASTYQLDGRFGNGPVTSKATLTVIQWPTSPPNTETQLRAHGGLRTHENVFISFKIRKETFRSKKMLIYSSLYQRSSKIWLLQGKWPIKTQEPRTYKVTGRLDYLWLWMASYIIPRT